MIGEPLNPNSGPDLHFGAAWVYERTGSASFAPPVRLRASDRGTGDTFGTDVDIDGDVIVVGAGAAQKFNFPFRDGAAYVFQNNGSTWVETDLLRAPDGFNDERFGDAVAVSGLSAFVGAPRDTNSTGPAAGAVYTYDIAALPSAVNTFVGVGSFASWNSPSNWSSGFVPAAGEAAIVPAGLTANVLVGAAASVGALTVDGIVNVAAGFEIGGDSTIGSTGVLFVDPFGLVTLSSNVDVVSGGQIIVRADAFLDAAGGSALTGAGLVANSGVFTKTGGGTATIGSALTWNSGPLSEVRVAGGILAIESINFDSNGTLAIAPGAIVRASAGWDMQPTSVLEIAVEGDASVPANYGQLVAVNGGFSALGTLRIIGGFTPTFTDVYPLVVCTAGGCDSGVFDTLDIDPFVLTSSPSGLSFRGTAGQPVPVIPPTGLTIDISPSTESAEVGVDAIDIASLPASVFQGYGGPSAQYARADLQTIDLRADTVESTPVAEVTLAELALDSAPVTRRLLSTILLSDIPIEGGWSARLRPAGPPLVEQTLSLLDVYEDYGDVLDGIQLGDLGLQSSTLGSISTYAALLAGVPVAQLPVPESASSADEFWCALVANAGLNCAADFGSAPLTLPVLSFAGVDVESAEFLGALIDGNTDLAGTPIGSTLLGQLNIGAVPLASQPLVPSKSLPSYLPSTVEVPGSFRALTLGDLGPSAPLAALVPGDVVGLIDSTPVSDLDIEFQPDSPLADYSWVAPAAGASLLVSSEAPLAPAVASIPVSDLGLNAPVLSVPLDELILPNGRALGDYRLVELLGGEADFGAAPFAASPFAASPFGASPFAASSIGAAPFRASPFRASPFRASPFRASPFAASPFRASAVGTTPFRASPFRASPFRASPFAASTFGVSPFQRVAVPCVAVPCVAVPCVAVPCV